MKIFPDFTWEYLIEFFQHWRDNNQKAIDPNEHEMLNNYYRHLAQWGHAILDLIPKFREHPQLGKYVPYRGMWALLWFPSDAYQILFQNTGNDGEFEVSVLRAQYPQDIVEKKIVSQDEVVDQVYQYILQYDDGLRTEEHG